MTLPGYGTDIFNRSNLFSIAADGNARLNAGGSYIVNGADFAEYFLTDL